jgi:hypothetical protein
MGRDSDRDLRTAGPSFYEDRSRKSNLRLRSDNLNVQDLFSSAEAIGTFFCRGRGIN